MVEKDPTPEPSRQPKSYQDTSLQNASSKDTIQDALESFSLLVTPPVSREVEPAFTINSLELQDSDLLVTSLPIDTALSESPDDVFAESFMGEFRGASEVAPEVLEFLIEALHECMGQDLEEGEIASVRFKTRAGGRGGATEDGPVRWISIKDSESGESLLPDFQQLTKGSHALDNSSERASVIERFNFGEARVLALIKEDGVAFAPFATRECLPEAIEHFIAALRGSGAPSLLHHWWEMDLAELLTERGLTDEVGEDGVQAWLSSELCTQIAYFTVSTEGGRQMLQLKISPRNEDDQIFKWLFGVRELICDLTFEDSQSGIMCPPRSDWRLGDS